MEAVTQRGAGVQRQAGIRRGELCIAYQPKIDLLTGMAVEADGPCGGGIPFWSSSWPCSPCRVAPARPRRTRDGTASTRTVRTRRHRRGMVSRPVRLPCRALAVHEEYVGWAALVIDTLQSALGAEDLERLVTTRTY